MRGKGTATLILERAIHEIVAERAPINVRGIAYGLFTQGLISSMATANTAKVSRITTAMRESGDLDWTQIVDGSREVSRVSQWDGPTELIRQAMSQYRKDRWLEQDVAVEVWSEKATVAGVLAPVLDEWGVTFRVMKGWGSFTAVKAAAEATRKAYFAGKQFKIVYVGDWDPSGMYMSEEDLPNRLNRYGATGHFERIAILEQDHHLPKFSALSKKSDKRYQWFADRYGNDCWELDALDPNELRSRVDEQIRTSINLPLWERSAVAEAAERESMEEFFSQMKKVLGEVA
jgi:hypothetical protein